MPWNAWSDLVIFHRREPSIVGRAVATLCALIALALVLAPTASAVLVQVGSSTVGYEPVHQGNAASAKSRMRSRVSPQVVPAAKSSLEYHGGPVMPSNTNYAIYWDPAGAPSYPAGYQAGIDRWFEDIAHDSGGFQNTDSVLTQYGDSAGEKAAYQSSFAGALTDTDPYPSNGCSSAPTCFTDGQLRTELVQYVEAHSLPTDLRHQYFLLTPPGVESCLEGAGKSCSAGARHAAYCSYHGFISLSKGVLVYANTPYMAGTNCDPGEEHPNENPSDATLAGGLVHEHSESITDPELNAWYDSKKEEVADKCRTFKASTEFGAPLGKAPDGSNYNQLINGDRYWYQQEWSNSAGACEQRAVQSQPPPAVTALSPKSGPKVGGTPVTITGTGFSSPATVKFGATAASEVKVLSSTKITAVSPPGAAGSVNVTVTTEAGTSAPGRKSHFKYKK